MDGAGSSTSRGNKGFTLIELLVAVVILGVLATLVIPKVVGASIRARVAEACTVLASYDDAQLSHLSEVGDIAPVAGLIIENPCAAGYSEYFDYAESVNNGVNATLGATDRGVVGPTSGDEIWTTVGVDLSVVHDHDPSYAKYAPLWKK
jgi:prepilin-type N-terminal cleavage/methylation domain-containing protein